MKILLILIRAARRFRLAEWHQARAERLTEEAASELGKAREHHRAGVSLRQIARDLQVRR